MLVSHERWPNIKYISCVILIIIWTSQQKQNIRSPKKMYVIIWLGRDDDRNEEEQDVKKDRKNRLNWIIFLVSKANWCMLYCLFIYRDRDPRNKIKKKNINVAKYLLTHAIRCIFTFSFWKKWGEYGYRFSCSFRKRFLFAEQMTRHLRMTTDLLSVGTWCKMHSMW